MRIVKYNVINNINLPYHTMPLGSTSVACNQGDCIYVIEHVVFYNNIYKEMKIPLATIKANPHFFEEVKTIEGVLIEMPYPEYNFDYKDATYCKKIFNFRDEVGNILLSLVDITQIMILGKPIREMKLSVEKVLFLERIEKLKEVLA